MSPDTPAPRGRPPLPKDQRKTHVVSIRLAEKDWSALHAAATSQQLTVSKWVLQCLRLIAD